MLGANAPAGRSVLDAVNLTALMERSAGRPEVIVGLIDGSVAATHSALATESIRVLPHASDRAPEHASAAALAHGTFVAGILAAKRGSTAPAICPRLHPGGAADFSSALCRKHQHAVREPPRPGGGDH